MKASKLVVCLSILLLGNGCIKQKILPSCETNGTAEVYFENSSTTGKTYDVIWDGTKMATIGPGQKSSTFTVTATVSHSLTFRVANTTTLACSTSYPSLVKCTSLKYYCSF